MHIQICNFKLEQKVTQEINMKKTIFALLIATMVGCSSSKNINNQGHWYLSSSDSAGYQYMTADTKSKGLLGFKCLSNTPTLAFYLSEKLGEETSPVQIHLNSGDHNVDVSGSLYVDSVRSGWAKITNPDNKSLLSLFKSEPSRIEVSVSGELREVRLVLSGVDFLDGYSIFSSLCEAEGAQ